MTKNYKITTIIPAYNEEKIIASVLQEVKKYTDEIILVDDGSKDRTAEIAEKEGVLVLRHLINRGQGASLKTGTDYALMKGAEIIVHFDADGQHRPEDIYRLAEPILKGEAEIVLGSRFLSFKSNIFWSRKIILKMGIVFNYFISGIKLTDSHNGLRALSRKAAKLIDIKQDRMSHNSEIIQKISQYNLAYKEIPVTIFYSSYSKNKGQSSLDAFKIVWELFLGKILK